MDKKQEKWAIFWCDLLSTVIYEEIEPELLQLKIPTFTLQPIVENAVKHGISNLLDAGIITISAKRSQNQVKILVEDNAGCFCDKLNSGGLGMNIVDKRIKNLFGSRYGLQTECIPDQATRVALVLPYKGREVK